MKTLCCLLFFLLTFQLNVSYGDNQTADNSPILTEDGLPFQLKIEQMGFQLPVGLHSGAVGVYKGLWVFFCGRINGLHGFINEGSFPAIFQNTSIYVVNPQNGSTYSRDLNDSTSGLSSEQIESLSVTSPESYQEQGTLYVVGGYGVNSRLGSFDTKPTLTAINLPGIIDWVINNEGSVAKNISQISDPTFQIAGGQMLKIGDVMQLVFGQNFTGEYSGSANGQYSEQVRQFAITSNHGSLGATIYPAKSQTPNPNFRRRDLNVLPALFTNNNDRTLTYGLVAFAGVFTTSGGAWNVPVVMKGTNEPFMGDTNDPTTFKQSLNVYASAAASLYSRRTKDMYNVILGGLTYQYYSNGILVSDGEIPFTTQIATVKMDKLGFFSQYLMNAHYPSIPTPDGTGDTGYYLLGAGAFFVPNNTVSSYPNHVINLDAIRSPTIIGYIVGGIRSPVYDTTTSLTQTSSSPYVFSVTLSPKVS